MIIEYKGEKISIRKESGEQIDFTASELWQLKALQKSLFGPTRTHAYLPIPDFKRYRRIKEVGIELLEACKATKDNSSRIDMISKFQDFKFAIYGRKNGM